MGNAANKGATRAVRLIDVAERAGVSIATASRSLSGTSGVSTAVAEHVREVASTMGYAVNPHARSLAGGVSTIVGLVVYEIDDPYFSEVARGVIAEAEERGWSVQLSHQARRPGAELDAVRLMRAQQLGAIIVAGSGYEVDQEASPQVAAVTKELAEFRRSGGRVAVIGRRPIECATVLPDNHGAGRSIARHLRDLGHRSIAVAAGPAHLTTVADRLAGIREELSPDALTGVWHAEFTRDGGRECAERILLERPETTAIIALNDTMATGVLSRLREDGRRVPQDISVTGVDDVQVAQDLSPRSPRSACPWDSSARKRCGWPWRTTVPRRRR